MAVNSMEKSLFQELITEQIEKWERIRSKKYKREDERIPVITVSTEPGSGGSVIARRIVKRLELDLFHREIIKEIAESVDMSPEVVESLEKERMSGIEDFVSSLLMDQYLWPGLYLEHLEKVVGAIGKHGGAVIVGRGANFILDKEDRLSLRVVAPFDLRVQNVAHRYGVSIQEAKHRVVNRESKRRSFIKNSFQADVTNPLNYDLVINTGSLSIEDAVEAISLFWGNKYFKTTDK
ncbi:MAG: cytidylate kinase-like family protein [Deltaproteobacteria bacterium]|nr:cytidylate kinase-like family protein [Deltaproteobacteria bacterium]